MIYRLLEACGLDSRRLHHLISLKPLSKWVSAWIERCRALSGRPTGVPPAEPEFRYDEAFAAGELGRWRIVRGALDSTDLGTIERASRFADDACMRWEIRRNALKAARAAAPTTKEIEPLVRDAVDRAIYDADETIERLDRAAAPTDTEGES